MDPRISRRRLCRGKIEALKNELVVATCKGDFEISAALRISRFSQRPKATTLPNAERKCASVPKEDRLAVGVNDGINAIAVVEAIDVKSHPALQIVAFSSTGKDVPPRAAIETV